MSNFSSSTFRFRQFSLSNEHSAMKIGTDGVLLGAWAHTGSPRRVLDVGAGTGLLALMMAQRCPTARIVGVEIDPLAAAEATANVAQSPWSSRVEIRNADISLTASQYSDIDLIVSNPPFFNTALHSPLARRADARHEGSLTFDFLLAFAARALSPDGSLAMISPYDRRDDIEWAIAFHRLSLQRLTEVRTVSRKPPRRILWQVGRSNGADGVALGAITINSAPGVPTDEYRDLTSDFYI